jgi:hypothetical protein
MVTCRTRSQDSAQSPASRMPSRSAALSDDGLLHLPTCYVAAEIEPWKVCAKIACEQVMLRDETSD